MPAILLSGIGVLTEFVPKLAFAAARTVPVFPGDHAMPTNPLDPGSIDFELTDFDDARHALNELPPGVEEAQHLRPGYWEGRRRTPVATDRALAGPTIDWVIGLPSHLRPAQLCEHFPRIANLMASVWHDQRRCDAVFASLLTDTRGSRHGFPATIEHEVHRLSAFRAGALRR
jgi:hypothetical protein